MKKRILFVEDDPLLLQMYVMMLVGEEGSWEVATADGGRTALSLMERTPFDVVVSDMNMPGMNGIELISEVKRRYPGTSRIILSALDDQEKVARCLGTTHQFLAKPFNVRELKATLARIGGLDAYLENEKLKTLIGRVGTLPSFPSLYLEITRELNSEDPSVESVASIIARDPGMTAKVLQIVNSAALGLAHRVGSPFEAVQFLGMGTVRSLVLSAHIFASFEPAPSAPLAVGELWDHAMRTAAVARRIAQVEHAEAIAAEEAYTAGMLHDLGKLMLNSCVPDAFQKALALAAEQHAPLHAAEIEVLGATHAGAAAYLLGLWGLPAAMVEAVAFHHTPKKSVATGFGPLTAVHVADVLDHELNQTESGDGSAELDSAYLASLRLGNRIGAWRAAAMRLLEVPAEDG